MYSLLTLPICLSRNFFRTSLAKFVPFLVAINNFFFPKNAISQGTSPKIIELCESLKLVYHLIIIYVEY